MGRAPNSGAPQRVSAHVVPKARAGSSSFAPPPAPDDDEKTTIDAGWSEEPSTTVEQGEVAERIRALGVEPRHKVITNITSTGAGALEEPTVDDQRSTGGLALLSASHPPARLVITSGKDSGHELVLEPGKTYTVGRAIDNDLVLTDIAVSRKHFDLRYADGAWMIVDRGSGNGTLVNGNLEDHPFALAHGDAVEIGNTIFRFDQPSATTRPAPTIDLSMDQSLDQPLDQDLGQHLGQPLGQALDEEEPSTIAGKPVRTDEVPTPAQMPPPARVRPKTMPPPLRPRTSSVAPSVSANAAPSGPAGHAPGGPPPHAPSHGHLAPPAPVARVSAGMPASAPIGNAPLPGRSPSAAGPVMLVDHGPSRSMPAVLPAQSAPMPALYGYPHAGDLPPQHAPNIGPHSVTGMPARDPTSTALVPPARYGVHGAVAQPYRVPVISRRAKLVLGGAALTLFAAISTVAIIKGTSGGRADAGTSAATAATDPEPVAQRSTATVSPITEAIQGRPVTLVDNGKPAAETKAEPVEDAPAIEITEDEPSAKASDAEAASQNTPADTSSQTLARAEDRDPEPAPVRAVAKKDPPKTEAASKKATPERAPTRKEPAKQDPPKKEPTKRVAAGDTSAVRAKAERLYRDKSFSAAAKVLRDAASSFGPDEASDLRSLAGTYEAFGKAFNLGMAPNTPAKQAWDALTRANSYDRSAGNAFGSEITERLGKIAPKAAAAFMASRDYVKAKRAVGLAESTGNRNSTTDGVRQSLESAAGQLYRQAEAEMSSNPAAAKAKLKTIQGMVDSKSPWHQRAGKLLSGARR